MFIHKGRSVLNKFINRLPIELNLPGYQYCGPGLKLAKCKARGDPGINPLNAAWKEHDIAYSRNREDVEARNATEFSRTKPGSAFGQRTLAWAKKLPLTLQQTPWRSSLSSVWGWRNHAVQDRESGLEIDKEQFSRGYSISVEESSWCREEGWWKKQRSCATYTASPQKNGWFLTPSYIPIFRLECDRGAGRWCCGHSDSCERCSRRQASLGKTLNSTARLHCSSAGFHSTWATE